MITNCALIGMQWCAASTATASENGTGGAGSWFARSAGNAAAARSWSQRAAALNAAGSDQLYLTDLARRILLVVLLEHAVLMIKAALAPVVEILQNTFFQAERAAFAQLGPASSFLRSALQFPDRFAIPDVPADVEEAVRAARKEQRNMEALVTHLRAHANHEGRETFRASILTRSYSQFAMKHGLPKKAKDV